MDADRNLGKSHLTVGKIGSIFLGLRTHLDKVSNVGKTAKQPAGSGCAGEIIPSRVLLVLSVLFLRIPRR